MDFARLTAEDILDALPPGDEDNRWELKSSILLTPPQKGELKKELGKQVSAFANSGGGNLVFGISTTRVLEPCEMKVGRQSMKDYLATMVEQSVEHPIRHFRIHQVELKDDSHKAIFVVEIEDSPAAPHQAKDERAYYYRIDGHSKPAPHFHLELLRNRMTKVVLEIEEIDYQFQRFSEVDMHACLEIALNVKVRNCSMQSAKAWGVHIRFAYDSYVWEDKRTGDPLKNGVFAYGANPVLLPTERATATAFVKAVSPYRGTQDVGPFERLWEEFGIKVRAVSHNSISEEQPLLWQDVSDWHKARDRLRRAFGH